MNRRAGTQKKGVRGEHSKTIRSSVSDGTLTVSAPPKKATLQKQIIFNVLSAVMPAEKAKLLAGYSKNTNPDKLKGFESTVESIRENLQKCAGVTLADQVAWYVKASPDPSKGGVRALACRKQIDKIMGYEAPQKVEVNEKREIVAAVHIFKEFSSEIGMNPRQLKHALANARIADAEVVDINERIEG